MAASLKLAIKVLSKSMDSTTLSRCDAITTTTTIVAIAIIFASAAATTAAAAAAAAAASAAVAALEHSAASRAPHANPRLFFSDKVEFVSVIRHGDSVKFQMLSNAEVDAAIAEAGFAAAAGGGDA